MTKLLICGISGLTGYKIANLASNFDVTGVYNTRSVKLDCETVKADLSISETTDNLFSKIEPDIVINTTALHNVDFCEENPEKSFEVNTKLVQNLFDNCEKINARLIHLSTDYVFDGKKSKPYTTDDTPNPINQYGKTKLSGEKILENSNHVVIRPSVVYGWTPLELSGQVSSSGKPINFAMWLLNSLHQKKTVKIVSDQFATATLADSLAELTLDIATTKKSGLYHVSGLSCESRYEFSQKFAKEFGYDIDLIQSVTSTEFKQKAKRPMFSCLDCKTTIEDFNSNLLKTEDALKIMHSQVEKDAPYLLGKNFSN